jgi:hypothetical protein
MPEQRGGAIRHAASLHPKTFPSEVAHTKASLSRSMSSCRCASIASGKPPLLSTASIVQKGRTIEQQRRSGETVEVVAIADSLR